MGISYLHHRTPRIIHRDLKPDNIFLSKNNILKIADFGLARNLENTQEQAQSKVGSLPFMAPEIIDNKSYDKKVDIYALGQILYYMFTRQLIPVSDVIKDKISISQIIPQPFQDLIKSMLKWDPEMRPNIDQILGMDKNICVYNTNYELEKKIEVEGVVRQAQIKEKSKELFKTKQHDLQAVENQYEAHSMWVK
eukprot:403376266